LDDPGSAAVRVRNEVDDVGTDGAMPPRRLARSRQMA
jgi:hypothetical protein